MGQFSIKTAWALIIAAVVLVPCFVLFPVYSINKYNNELKSTLRVEELATTELKNSIIYEVRSVISLMENKSDSIAYSLANKKENKLITSLSRSILLRNDIVHGVLVIDVDGKILTADDKAGMHILDMHSRGYSDGENWLKNSWQLEWREENRSPEFVVPALGRVYIGSAKFHEDTYMFTVSVPVKYENKLLAYLVAEIDTSILWKNKIKREKNAGISAYLIDGRGRMVTPLSNNKYKEGDLISHLDIVRSAIAHEPWDNSNIYQGMAGGEVFGILQTIPVLNWSVISEISEESISKPIFIKVSKAMVLVLILVILSIVIGIQLLKLMLKPVNDLSNAMKLYARDESLLEKVDDSKITELNTFIKGFNRMVVERRQMDYVLRNSQDRLRLHRDQAPLGVIEWNTKFEFLDWNPAAEKIFGFTRSEVLRKHISETILPASAKEAVDKIWSELLAGAGGEHGINENITKDGRIILCEWHNTPLKDDSGKVVGVASFVEDITEKKNQENKMRQTQKMDALGKLTSGISHDFNNLLNAILGYANLISERTDNDKIKKFSDIIAVAGQRGVKLTSKLLRFSAQESHEANVVDINPLIKDEQHIIEKALTARIQLELDLQDDLWPVLTDSADLQDAILNISINAMHAINKNGHIKITTRNTVLDETSADALNLVPGEYVLLKINDDGCGMDQKTLERIFDPFFTTKGEHGTGLGLSQVYGFVKRSEGGLEVKSELDIGTEINLYFPRHDLLLQIGEQEKKSGTEEDIDLKGSETVLIVDDEQGLRELGKELLSGYGYQVKCAKSAKEAIEILEKETVDLVMSDVVMPNMDGYQLAEVVQQRWPEIKIQMVSGFTDGRHENIEDVSLHKNLIKKPYELDILLKRLRQLLNG